jgi:hypothetical protein
MHRNPLGFTAMKPSSHDFRVVHMPGGNSFAEYVIQVGPREVLRNEDGHIIRFLTPEAARERIETVSK